MVTNDDNNNNGGSSSSPQGGGTKFVCPVTGESLVGTTTTSPAGGSEGGTTMATKNGGGEGGVSVGGGINGGGNADSSSSSTSTKQEDDIVALIRELAQKGDWDTLLQRIQNDPTEASLQDERGRTALHHACACSTCENDGSFFPTTNILKTILDACRAAAWTPDDFGWTPLSLACSNNAPEDVIRLLMNVHDAPISMQTHCGMTPLYLATWSRAPISVLEMLLEVGPSLVHWPTIVEETPLTLFWSESRNSLLRGLKSNEGEGSCMKSSSDPGSEEDWKRLELFLKAGCYDSISDPLPGNVKFRPLHAACSMGCPLPLVKAVMKRHPEQIWERDEYGRLPLTLAASAPVYEPPSSSSSSNNNKVDEDDDDEEEVVNEDEENEEEEDDDEDEYGEEYGFGAEEPDEGDSIDLEDVAATNADDDDNENIMEEEQDTTNNKNKKQSSSPSPSSSSSLIDILVRANPTAAKIPDPYGRLPLYLAIESQKTWSQGLRSLLDVTPQVLTGRDNVTHMYPFMLAAVEDLQSVDVVFKLLVAYPEALGTCLPSLRLTTRTTGEGGGGGGGGGSKGNNNK